MVLDQETTVAKLKERVKKFVEEREWKKYHTPKDLAISITLEAAELLEIFQWLKEDEIEELIENPEKLKEIESELADVIIYCLSLSNTLDMDLSRVVLEKMSKNERKYPVEEVKGKHRRHTEIGEK